MKNIKQVLHPIISIGMMLLCLSATLSSTAYAKEIIIEHFERNFANAPFEKKFTFSVSDKGSVGCTNHWLAGGYSSYTSMASDEAALLVSSAGSVEALDPAKIFDTEMLFKTLVYLKAPMKTLIFARLDRRAGPSQLITENPNQVKAIEKVLRKEFQKNCPR